MCGLLGVVSKNTLHDRQEISAALDLMIERGPDGKGIWSDHKQVTLAHRRLAIVDQDNGHQPIFNENKNIVAIVNGEFYNHEKIRKKLCKKGHRFHSQSDSEIIVHLYEEYGEECVQHLDGEFTFILWDRDKELLLAARDPFGVKPLVFSEHEGHFYFASKAKAILALTGYRKWNTFALLSSLRHQYAPPTMSLFDGIEVLPPGHLLTLSKGGLKTRFYTDFIDQDSLPKETFSLRELLEKAVKKRTQGDQKITCTLSGGIDSSAIAALLSKQQENTEAFCLIFDGQEDADREDIHAQRVADFLDVDLHLVEISPRGVLENLAPAIYHSEGLCINGHLSAKFLLSKAIHRAGYKVALSGEGADELFFGYPHLRQDIFGSTAKAIYDFDRVSSGVMVAQSTDFYPEITERIGFTPAFFRAKRELGKRCAQLLHWGPQESMENQGLSLLHGFSIEKINALPIPVEKSRYLWTKLTLEKYILTTLGDGTEMAHSVEGRTPFLDKDIVLFSKQLSPKECFREGLEKIHLRDAMKGMLPEQTLVRHKQPFVGPPISFLDSTASLVQDRIEALRESPLWDRDALNKIWKMKRLDTQKEQRKWDPLFLLAFSTQEIQSQFSLEAPDQEWQ